MAAHQAPTFLGCMKVKRESEVAQLCPTLRKQLGLSLLMNLTPLQYSCLENPMDRGAWLAAVHGVAKSQTRLSDFTFTFHFSLSCIGEGNGNPLQCSCLENPRDRGGWWAAVYGVAQSWTQLKRLSSSSSSMLLNYDLHRFLNFLLQ